MAIPQEIIEAVRERTSIVDVVGESVRLKPSGRNHVGLCPFHKEKTPSFYVWEDESRYHCFGCGQHGSAFDFVMATKGLTFPEAVRLLAGRIGVQIPERTTWKGGREAGARESSARRSRQSLLREVVGLAARTYVEQLFKEQKNEAARTYLTDRGISAETAKRFGLGYSPDSWNFIGARVRALASERGLHTKGLSPEEFAGLLREVGLVKPRSGSDGERPQSGERGDYDAFRGRLIVPITRSDGVPVALGGRDIVGAPNAPKYINSPESPIYSKRKTLFGLAQALSAIRSSRHAFLVEGYFDVMSLSQVGIVDVVATCGTAVTPEHVNVLKRFVDRVSVVFDGDAAGRKAAAHCFEVFLNSGIDLGVVLLPAEDDPDTIARTLREREAVLSYFSDRRMAAFDNYVQFLFDGFATTSEQASAAIRGRVAARAVGQLAQVSNPVEREALLSRGASLIGVTVDSMFELLAREQSVRQVPAGSRRPTQRENAGGYPSGRRGSGRDDWRKKSDGRQPALATPPPPVTAARFDRIVREILLSVLLQPELVDQVLELESGSEGKPLSERLQDPERAFLMAVAEAQPPSLASELEEDRAESEAIFRRLFEEVG
ncbi:MAG: DNA primase, partial [Bdellovibrionales bacterium]|nr:DNA primase [Bdellovibrionales bacterium]